MGKAWTKAPDGVNATVNGDGSSFSIIIYRQLRGYRFYGKRHLVGLKVFYLAHTISTAANNVPEVKLPIYCKRD